MEMLEQQEDRFYPEDYLLSRLRGRKLWYKGLISNKSAESAWALLLSEYRWVYFQMNGNLRAVYEDYFIYSEIRTIILCLRYKMQKEKDVKPLLAYSLMSKGFKEMLRKCRTPLSCAGVVENLFSGLSSVFEGLADVYNIHDRIGFEASLRGRFLEYAVKRAGTVFMRDYFINIIDMRNIMNLYKHIRWKIKKDPVFVRGGDVSEGTLMDIFRKNNISGVERLVSRMTRKDITALSERSLETMLFDRLSLSIKNDTKDPLDTGNILNYLWRCYVETVDLGILFYSNRFGRDVVGRELLH